MKLQAIPLNRDPKASIFGALSFSVAVLLAGCASAPERSGPVQKNDYQHMSRTLDWMLATEMKRASVPGVAVAVVDDQRVVWSKGYGMAEAGASGPVSVDTCFRIGSVSKVVTATEIVRRVDRGEIDLDAPLADQLPGFGVRNRFAGSKPISVRALLSHHAGLPANHLHGMWEAQPDSLADLQAVLRDEALLAPPQTRYEYSNLGYALLGRLIEHKSGRPFAAAMRRDLLQPAGMSQAVFERTAQTQSACAKGHRKGKELRPTGLRDEPAGALVASAADMAQFLRFVLADAQAGGKELIRAGTFKTMFEPQFDGLPLDFGHRIGLGWMLSGVEVPGAGPIAWHSGQYPGYFAAVVVSRRDRLAAVALANDEAASGFAIEVAAKALELALEAKTGEAAPVRSAAAPAQRRASSKAELAALSGDYAVFGSKSKIVPKDGKLSADLFGNKLDLVPVADGRFALQKGVLGVVDIALPNMFVRFTSVEDRRYAVLDGLRAPMAFERITKKPIPPAWQARLGRYASQAGDSTMEFLKFELAIDEGVLVARVMTNSRVTGHEKAEGGVVLEPASDDIATVLGGGGMDGGALQATRRNGKDVLSYSGYVLTRIDN